MKTKKFALPGYAAMAACLYEIDPEKTVDLASLNLGDECFVIYQYF